MNAKARVRSTGAIEADPDELPLLTVALIA
jgi:hypothetical protein